MEKMAGTITMILRAKTTNSMSTKSLVSAMRDLSMSSPGRNTISRRQEHILSNPVHRSMPKEPYLNTPRHQDNVNKQKQFLLDSKQFTKKYLSCFYPLLRAFLGGEAVHGWCV